MRVSTDVLNDNLRIFVNDDVYTKEDIKRTTQKFKNFLRSRVQNRKIVLAFNVVDFENLCLTFAALELNFNTINHRTAEAISDVYQNENCIFLTNSQFISNWDTDGIFLRDCYLKNPERVINISAVDLNEFPEVADDPHTEESEDPIFTFFSSGTTGKSMEYSHNHSTLMASVKNGQTFFEGKKTFMLLNRQTINHFGVLSGILIPALICCENLVILDVLELHRDVKLGAPLPKMNKLLAKLRGEGIEVDAMAIFSYCTYVVEFILPFFAKHVNVVTGGSAITLELFEQIAKMEDFSCFNLFGCTELATPLLWRKFSKEEYTTGKLSHDEIQYFDCIAPRTEYELNDEDLIVKFLPNDIFFHGNELYCNDIIRVENNRFKFVDRRFFCIEKFSPSGEKLQITFTSINSFASSFFKGKRFAIIKVANTKDKKYFNDNDNPFSYAVFVEGDLEGQNVDTVAKAYFETFNFTVADKDFRPFCRVLSIPDMSQYFTGLKYDGNRLKDLFYSTIE